MWCFDLYPAGSPSTSSSPSEESSISLICPGFSILGLNTGMPCAFLPLGDSSEWTSEGYWASLMEMLWSITSGRTALVALIYIAVGIFRTCFMLAGALTVSISPLPLSSRYGVMLWGLLSVDYSDELIFINRCTWFYKVGLMRSWIGDTAACYLRFFIASLPSKTKLILDIFDLSWIYY